MPETTPTAALAAAGDRATANWRLIVSPFAGPQRHALRAPRLFVSRDSAFELDEDVQLVTVPEPGVSPYQLKGRIEDGRLLVHDPSSLKGTFVNGRRLEPGRPRCVLSIDRGLSLIHI